MVQRLRKVCRPVPISRMPHGVEPGHGPQAPEAVVDEVEDRTGERRPDQADDEGRADRQRRPPPDRQDGPGTADHRDRGVGADADRDQQEEDALTSGVVLGGRCHVRDLQRGALVRRDRGEDLLYDGGAGVGTRGRHQQLGHRLRQARRCPLCPLGTGSTGRTLRRPGRRTLRRDHIRTEDVLVLEPVDRRRPVADGPDLQVTARLVVDRLGEQLCAVARSDDRDGQLVRRGVRKGAQVRQAHPDAHQQRGDQVRQDVTQPGGVGERAERWPPCCSLRWSGRRTVLMGQAFSTRRLSCRHQWPEPVVG